jgi:hypothetical protein
MSSDNEGLRRSLVAKFGTAINFESEPGVLTEILNEIANERINLGGRFGGTNAAYDRTYTEGYNKEDYSKAEYNKYDKTNNIENITREAILEIRPELDKLVLERIRAIKRPPN